MREDADAEASAYARAMIAKRRELAAHARAIELHERAAELQERLGHADRAANARQHADHARELHEQALAEQTALETEPPRGGDEGTGWPTAGGGGRNRLSPA